MIQLKTQNASRRSMKVPAGGWYLSFFRQHTSQLRRCKRCLEYMIDPGRKQFEYARQSESGKEQLKTCKAVPKATQLEGINVSPAPLHFITEFLVWDIICFEEGPAPPLPPNQASNEKENRHRFKGRGVWGVQYSEIVVRSVSEQSFLSKSFFTTNFT